MNAPRDEAAEWLIELQCAPVTREMQEKFADWLRRSPVHVQEFLQLTALQGELASSENFKRIDVSSLLQRQLAAGNVIELGLGNSSSFEQRRKPLIRNSRRFVRWTSGMRTAVAVMVVSVGALASLPLRSYFAAERYETQIGEQRSLVLPDGTHVQLNVRSNLTSLLDKEAREIRLNDGEALFAVARDPARPFRVHTPEAMIEAIGTQFNVHVTRGQTVVTLIEGKVRVTSEDGSSPVLLHPGQKLSVGAEPRGVLLPRQADLKVATAWTERRLVFENAPLSAVVAEFNRYSRQPLAIDDPALARLRITASFDSGSVDTFADTLAAAGRLHVTRKGDGTWLIER